MLQERATNVPNKSLSECLFVFDDSISRCLIGLQIWLQRFSKTQTRPCLRSSVTSVIMNTRQPQALLHDSTIAKSSSSTAQNPALESVVYLLFQSLWASAWLLNVLLEQCQQQLYLQELCLNLPQYPRNPVDSSTLVSPLGHCSSCSTDYGDAPEQATPKANSRARDPAKERQELQHTAAGAVNNVEAAQHSTTNQACAGQPSFAKLPDPSPVKQRRRCDHALLPTLEDAPIPNCQRNLNNTEGDGFTLTTRSRHQRINAPLS